MKSYKLDRLADEIIDKGSLSKENAYELICLDNPEELISLYCAAYKIFNFFCDKKAELCAITNAKSGKCSEDCAYCAQSSWHHSRIKEYPFLSADKLIEDAKKAERMGAHRFSLVTSGNSIAGDIKKAIYVCKLVKEQTKLEVDCSFGSLSDNEIKSLMAVGVKRFHHNLETSENFFPNICSTHSFQERVALIKRVKSHGAEVCSGGIIGLGESPKDRVDLAFALKELDVQSVPINILNPIKGTKLENQAGLSIEDVLKTIAVFRLVLPDKVIKLAGGRESMQEHQCKAFEVGLNGLLIGGYLTTEGDPVKKDLDLIRRAGLEF